MNVKLRITKNGLPYYEVGSTIHIPKDHFYKHFPEEIEYKKREEKWQTLLIKDRVTKTTAVTD